MTDNDPESPQRVLSLFEEGRRFTEQLMQENERLRALVASIRAEKMEVEERLALSGAGRTEANVRLLEDEIRALKQENADLKAQFNNVEEENREFADRYVEIERQNSNLINLYVASYRLHSTVDNREVIKIIKEIVINMVGSECFGVYVLDEPGTMLHLVTHEGMEAARESIRVGEGYVGKAAQGGEIFVSTDATGGEYNQDRPIACIPLVVTGQIIGVIAIFKLLPQKNGFEAIDHELFEFLGGHAATAIYVSTLYSLSERKRNTLEGFINLLKDG